MPDEPIDASTAGWTRAAELDRLQPSHPIAVKLNGKHIALFLHHGEVLACNNRCPHEGYPLVDGTLDADCVLTCNWHNWKFDLRGGRTLYGGDNLRAYPASVRNGAIWVDLRDAPAAKRIGETLAHLDVAIDDYDTARIARELARLAKAGASLDVAVSRIIAATHDRLRDGMTHAYAAADAWLRLRDALDDDASRLACATEVLGHIAYDTLREPVHPYADKRLQWNTHAFAAAVEAQDEECAVALIEGALHAGLRFADIEPALAAAALAHYNDFGHSLIYLMHVDRLAARLGRDVERPLLRAWVRSLIYATREDLLPDFRGYADALKSWTASASTATATAPVNDPGTMTLLADTFEGKPIRATIDAALQHAALPTEVLHAALLEAAARHLLRFDEAQALRTDNSVADNVGWLDFTHALTFAHALRWVCGRHPELWSAGLLQLSLFVGRTAIYLDADLKASGALRAWEVTDEAAFDRMAIARLVDHGIGLPIFPAHLLKTWSAVREMIGQGVPDSTRAALLAATNRLFAARFKQRHSLRAATQALRFVEREG